MVESTFNASIFSTQTSQSPQTLETAVPLVLITYALGLDAVGVVVQLDGTLGIGGAFECWSLFEPESDWSLGVVIVDALRLDGLVLKSSLGCSCPWYEFVSLIVLFEVASVG
jgi:hypothetical protein